MWKPANGSPSSICAIGAVKVVGGIDYRQTLLACKGPNRIIIPTSAPGVHGLTDEDTYNAPSFGTVWNNWSEWIGTMPLVAHNAVFDAGCIRQACRIYGLEPPEQKFHCTLQGRAENHTSRSLRFQITRFTMPVLRNNTKKSSQRTRRRRSVRKPRHRFFCRQPNTSSFRRVCHCRCSYFRNVAPQEC